MATIKAFSVAEAALVGEGARVGGGDGGSAALSVGPGGAHLRFAWPADAGAVGPDACLAVDVYHALPLTLPVSFAFGEAEGAEPAIHGNAGVLPGVRTRVFFPLSALNAETVFIPRTPGRLKMVVFGRPTAPERLAWASVGVGAIGEAGAVEFSGLRLLSEPEPLAPEGAPVTDALGQWTARDWPGKTRGVDVLTVRLRQEDARPVRTPEGRTRFGGSEAVRFEATGSFRTHHDGRRWWLVDPDGGAFFSAGVDCVRPEAECRVAGNESLCEWLPPRAGEYADAWLGDERFAWSIANLIRAFGRDWRPAWERLARKWLVGWGFNTVGNWSDTGFARRSGLPYVLPLAGFPTTPKTVFRDFPDVFAPEYALGALAFARQLEEFRGDPALIGYFLRNEPLWAFGVFRIAEEMLARDPGRAPGSRRALAEHLSAAYAGAPARFAEAWGGAVSAFEEIERLVVADPDTVGQRARADLAAFSRKMVDAYVRIPSEACRAVDPDHLNLGMRWAWIASDDLLAGLDACDVFSLNMYRMDPDAATIERVARASGKPVMIGEFHWGARDRGLPSTGLRAVPSQAERGKAYRYFVEQGAALPDLVGAHYFQMNDQPVLGRFDGENFQIGLVDACWRAYDEMLSAARETHARIYEVAAGQCAPFSEVPVEVPRVGF